MFQISTIIDTKHERAPNILLIYEFQNNLYSISIIITEKKPVKLVGQDTTIITTKSNLYSRTRTIIYYFTPLNNVGHV